MEDISTIPSGKMEDPGEMPGGEMNAGSGMAGVGQMPSGEMPRGEMTTRGELPGGELHESAGLDTITTIDLPGVWQLTLTRISP